MNLPALAALLTAISETHHELGALYADLAAQLDPTGVVDGDVLMVARVIQGEGAALFGARRDEVARWIAHTAYNRYERPWWQEIDGVPCTFAEATEAAFNGVALVDEDDVQPWAIRIAHEVITERRAGGDDGARGAVFAMSFADLHAHGWLERAHEVLVQAIASPAEPHLHQFWFMWDDPAGEPNVYLHNGG